MKTSNVLDRRGARPNDHDAWSWHVRGLGQASDKDVARRKAEYEERRRFLRSNLDKKSSPSRRNKGRQVYTPKNIASQHAIALGVPSDKRGEFDARRNFLRSNLSQEERAHLAALRGEELIE